MIHFDKKTYKTLKKIYDADDKGVRWGDLRKIFGDDGLHSILCDFDAELYTVNMDEDGNWITLNCKQLRTSDNFRAYITPKGGEFIWKRIIQFRRWVIPTIISTVAFFVSVLSLIFTINCDRIIKVLLL